MADNSYHFSSWGGRRERETHASTQRERERERELVDFQNESYPHSSFSTSQ
jgi:hypothetical protein